MNDASFARIADAAQARCRGGQPAVAAVHPGGETTNASEPLKINVDAAIMRSQLRRLG